MTTDEIRTAALEALTEVAPEVDPAHLRGDAPLRDQVDLDSMDFLNVLIGIHERLGVDFPEQDYDRVSTLDGLVGYVEDQLLSRPASES